MIERNINFLKVGYKYLSCSPLHKAVSERLLQNLGLDVCVSLVADWAGKSSVRLGSVIERSPDSEPHTQMSQL